jgi:hypothetical protein
MRRLVAVTAVIFVGVLAGVRSVEAQQATRANLGPLEFLVGSCWIGTFPGGTVTDEHCFEWVYDRKFIRDRHVVRGGSPYEGETIYGWDPLAKRLTWWYWSSDGQIIVGGVDYIAEEIVLPARYATPNGETELKAVLTRLGNDGYRVAQSERSGGVWKPLWTMDLARKR